MQRPVGVLQQNSMGNCWGTKYWNGFFRKWTSIEAIAVHN